MVGEAEPRQKALLLGFDPTHAENLLEGLLRVRVSKQQQKKRPAWWLKTEDLGIRRFRLWPHVSGCHFGHIPKDVGPLPIVPASTGLSKSLVKRITCSGLNGNPNGNQTTKHYLVCKPTKNNTPNGAGRLVEPSQGAQQRSVPRVQR